MHKSISLLLAEWEAWAAAADQADDGWQSDYPRWAELMEAATAAMEHPDNNLDAIEKCWLLSEEDEWLADHVRKNPSHYLKLLTALAKSNYPSVRWQVYASLEGASPIGADILESGSADPDAYARRRAILALAKAEPGLVLRKIDEFCGDPDPDNRLVFSKLRDELSKTTVSFLATLATHPSGPRNAVERAVPPSLTASGPPPKLNCSTAPQPAARYVEPVVARHQVVEPPGQGYIAAISIVESIVEMPLAR